MDQQAKIIEKPHLLFTGANGSRIAGIKVEAIGNQVRGYQHQWAINSYSLSHGGSAYMAGYLGITETELAKIIKECEEIEK